MKKYVKYMSILTFLLIFAVACSNRDNFPVEGTTTFDIEIIEIYSEEDSQLEYGKVVAREIDGSTHSEGYLVFSSLELPTLDVESGDIVSLTIRTPYAQPEAPILEVIDWELAE